MKKIGLFILVGLLTLSSMGCGEKETAAEIMTKVVQKATEELTEANGVEFIMDGTVALSMQGITIKPSFQVSYKVENITDSSNSKTNVQTHAEVMNEKFEMETWFVDDKMYVNVNGELTSIELNLKELLSQFSSTDQQTENEDFKEVYKGFTVEKSQNGYILSQEQTDFSSELNLVKQLAALSMGTEEDQFVTEILQSFNITSEILTFYVSKDYNFERANLRLMMEMEVEGQKLEMNLDTNLTYEFYEEERIQLPDLSKWNAGMQNASCVIEQDGIMKMDVDLSATDDEIDKMTMKITMDPSLFDGVDFTTLDEDAKVQVQEAMLEQLGLSADTKGLTTSVEVTDTMIITVDIDLKTASKEDLNKIGLDIDNTDMSFKHFIQSSKEEGYSCTIN